MSSVPDEHCRVHQSQLHIFWPSDDILDGLCTTGLAIKYGKCAISLARPATWNALPEDSHAVVDQAKFKKQLIGMYYFTTEAF